MEKYEEWLKSLDIEKLKKDVVDWIRNWFEDNGPGCNAVVGISGGKDSSVVAALCVDALGKDRVIGVLMPNGIQNDISYSVWLVDHLGIMHLTANIANAYRGVIESISDISITDQAKTNLPARIRMATLYAVAQSCNGRVANTCNLSEDWVGYSTRYGDSVGDFSPLSNLTTDEVIALGISCGLPEELVKKTPTDGLCGKTDEENLGFAYRQLNEYICTGVCDDKNIKRVIDKKHVQNLFKLSLMQSFDPKFERELKNNSKIFLIKG